MDDYSRWTWVMFLAYDESFSVFFKFCNWFQNEKGVCVTWLRSDHGEKLENGNFQLFCEENGILHNLSTLRTPR